MSKKKKKKCRGKAQKMKLRRKQWHAQSRGAPYKGQDTTPHPLSPTDELFMNTELMTSLLLLGRKRKKPEDTTKKTEEGGGEQ